MGTTITRDVAHDAPELHIGGLVAGATVVAAIRQEDSPGLLRGLHVVTALTSSSSALDGEYVTWTVAWQPWPVRRQHLADVHKLPYSLTEPMLSAELEELHVHVHNFITGSPLEGRWVANAGHYFRYGSFYGDRKKMYRDALDDMVRRA